MNPVKFSFPIAALLAAASLALPAAAQPNEVASLGVTGKPPTTLRVSIAGKDAIAIRRDVRHAARTVCFNAVDNHELDLGDVGWCRDSAQASGLKQFAALVRGQTFAAADIIILAAR